MACNSYVAQHQVNRQFSGSAGTYRCGATLQQKVAETCLNFVKNNCVQNALDLGCGPGLFTSELISRAQRFISLDLSHSMLLTNTLEAAKVQGDSHNLPLLSEQFDLVFSSLMLQWCDPNKVLQEVFRILKPGGQVVISTLTTGTLKELQYAWSQVDSDQHIHQYLSEHELKTATELNPWRQSQFATEAITLEFDTVKGLAKELKLLGANYVKDRKNKGLMTKSKWLAMETAYRQQFQSTNRIPATYNVMYLILEK